jgi:hypothetical protein
MAGVIKPEFPDGVPRRGRLYNLTNQSEPSLVQANTGTVRILPWGPGPLSGTLRGRSLCLLLNGKPLPPAGALSKGKPCIL